MGLEQAIEAEAQAQAICMQTADFERAYRAFVAKERPCSRATEATDRSSTGGRAMAESPHEFLNPTAWKPARGYANGVAATGRTLFLGGTIGWNGQQEFETDDFVGQVAQALRNIVEMLAEGGAGPEHLVRLTWYVTEPRRVPARTCAEMGAAYREIIGRHFPAMALVQVVALVEERAKVEIEATAVVPVSAVALGPSAHVDTFARDNLPPFDQWPDLLLDGYDYPEHLNAAVELTDRMVEQGFGDHTALIGNGRRRTYKELTDWTNRLAHALTEDYGVQPGNRVLIRSANNPAMVACWLAATKAGAVVVNTMPMLRAGELTQIVDKAEITLALCDTRLMDELVACAKDSRYLTKVVGFDGTANHDAELDRVALDKSVRYDAVRDRPRRRRAARLHVGHHRRAEGHDALPSRPADHRRRVREGGARRHARRRVRRVAAARVHVRARWAGRVPAALRRRGDAARERVAAEPRCGTSRSTGPPCASPRRPPTARC